MNVPPLTHGFLSDDENCPAKAWHKHVAKDLPKEAKTDAQSFGIDVHKAIEYRLRERKPLTGQMAAWEPFALAFEKAPGDIKIVEEQLAITADGSPCKFFADNVWLRTRIDSGIMTGQTLVLFDWKTGKPREDRLELELQALIVRCHYPNIVHARGHYVWLRENRLGPAHDLSDFGRTYNDVRLRARDIDSRPVDLEWVRRPNPLCGWCPVMKCPHNAVEKRNGKA